MRSLCEELVRNQKFLSQCLDRKFAGGVQIKSKDFFPPLFFFSRLQEHNKYYFAKLSGVFIFSWSYVIGSGEKVHVTTNERSSRHKATGAKEKNKENICLFYEFSN